MMINYGMNWTVIRSNYSTYDIIGLVVYKNLYLLTILVLIWGLALFFPRASINPPPTRSEPKGSQVDPRGSQQHCCCCLPDSESPPEASLLDSWICGWFCWGAEPLSVNGADCCCWLLDPPVSAVGLSPKSEAKRPSLVFGVWSCCCCFSTPSTAFPMFFSALPKSKDSWGSAWEMARTWTRRHSWSFMLVLLLGPLVLLACRSQTKMCTSPSDASVTAPGFPIWKPQSLKYSQKIFRLFSID